MADEIVDAGVDRHHHRHPERDRSQVRELAELVVDDEQGDRDDLGRAAQGRYLADDQWWRYTSLPIPDTPWRLSAAVPEDVGNACGTG